MNKIPVTAVILTYNEEKNIVRCISSLQWCSEIVVIDDCSTDQTSVLAQQNGARVVTQKFLHDFALQRNFALSQTKNEWMLFVDSDEEVSDVLRSEIEYLFSSPKIVRYNGFTILRKDYQFGKMLIHGETGNMRLLRLGRKSAGLWKRAIHEYWDIKGEIGALKNPLFHYPHQTISEFLSELNTYTTINAQVFWKEGYRASFFSILSYPIGKFFSGYFWKQGFRDGMPGLLLALFMSFHSFLTRSKLYFLQIKSA